MKRTAMFLVVLVMSCTAAQGAEGMWTLDRLPLKHLQQAYGFSPNQAWIDHVEHAALRLAGGCSGSFISPHGLVLSNHHCARECVQQLSTPQHNYTATGFYAKDEEHEVKCPTIELNRLDAITDVSAQVKGAVKGLSGDAYTKAMRAVRAKLTSACAAGDTAHTRCDVVELYHGGMYDLYKYHRYQDVRLVFVPEEAAAFFGGDPDNFNFPRYDLDMSLLRAYENGKPAVVKDWFAFSPHGADAGELAMTVGNPGSTQRLLTIAQLQALRDDALPSTLLFLAEIRGMLNEYATKGAEQARTSEDLRFGVENSLKALRGQAEALRDPKVFAYKQQQEDALRQYVDADPARKAKYGKAWDAIANAEADYRNFATRYRFIGGGRSRGFISDYFGYALMLVRGAVERQKPNAERLPEFSDAALPAVTHELFADSPVYPDLEKTTLGWSLTKLREGLGADDPFVRKVLGKEAPQAMADRLVAGTQLGDPAYRKQLWEGGEKAIEASTDPFIVLAREVDPDARALRKRFEDEVQSVTNRNAELIAQARFDKYGTSVYPDATFTLRLSDGTVKGWDEKGAPVPPFTDYSGAFARNTGEAPFALPQSWLDSKGQLDLSRHLNFVTDNDIIGGNSGSPVINRDAQIIGLIFDGNVHSLGGAFWFDDRYNRAVAVDSGAILEALRNIYHTNRIVTEIEAARTGDLISDRQ